MELDPTIYRSTKDLNQFTLAETWTEECQDEYPDGQSSGTFNLVWPKYAILLAAFQVSILH